jgi:hypothetical protein
MAEMSVTLIEGGRIFGEATVSTSDGGDLGGDMTFQAQFTPFKFDKATVYLYNVATVGSNPENMALFVELKDSEGNSLARDISSRLSVVRSSGHDSFGCEFDPSRGFVIHKGFSLGFSGPEIDTSGSPSVSMIVYIEGTRVYPPV